MNEQMNDLPNANHQGKDTSESTYKKFEELITGSESEIPSYATVEGFTQAMREKAAAEYVDSAVDPEWKILSNPDYPGRVDSKEWINKRKLRHPDSL